MIITAQSHWITDEKQMITINLITAVYDSVFSRFYDKLNK